MAKKPYKSFNKKGLSQAATFFTGLIVLMAFMGSVVWYVTKSPTPASSVTVTTNGQSSAPTTSVAAVSCPSGSSTNLKTQYEDTVSSTAAYAANVVSYAVLSKGGTGAQSFVTLANTSSTAQGYSSATAVECNTLNPVVYNIFAVDRRFGATASYGYTPAVGFVKPNINAVDVTAAGSTVYVDFKGQRTDVLKATIKDKNNRDTYLNATSASGTQSYTALNSSFSDVTGQTSLTIAADGYFDLEMSVKSNNTRNVFGATDPRTGNALTVFRDANYRIVPANTHGAVSHALRVIVAIDADASDWQEPSVSGGGITKITKSDLAPEDQTVLSSYEYFYTVNSLKDTDTIFRWFQQSKSGVNPSMDPKWRFVAEGIYSSLDESGVLKVGGFDDGSSNNELTQPSTSWRQEATIDIA